MMARLTLTEAAKVAGVTARRLRQLCQDGRVKGAAKVGPVWTVSADEDGRVAIAPGRRGPSSTVNRHCHHCGTVIVPGEVKYHGRVGTDIRWCDGCPEPTTGPGSRP